jgi:hypothetical protein
MSPEQFTGQKVDGRSDLFSLGIILYELATGEKPFSGEALSTVMHHVIRTEPIPPAELNFAVPHALNDVIMQALAKRPDGRYVDGHAMAAALREALKPQPNPHILFGMAAAEEATVNLAAAGSATVLTPGAAPSQGEATLSRGPQATPVVTAAAPPEPESTLHRAPVAAPRANLPLYGGAALVAVLVLAGLALMFRGGGGETPPPSSGAPAAAPAAGAEQPAAWFSNVVMDVYQAKDQQVYEAWQGAADSARNIDAIIDQVSDVPNCAVQIFDADTNALLVEREGFSSGRITWEGQPQRVRYVVTAGGVDSALMLTKTPGGPDASLGNVVVLLPPPAGG